MTARAFCEPPFVENASASGQNAPSHNRHFDGEVAERLNALVLKTSKGL